VSSSSGAKIDWRTIIQW